MNEHLGFIEEAKGLILEHAEDENFGVSELAEAMHMSRSNLLRKIKKETELSASQFIRQVRLARGMELLRQNSLTVSEVSYRVGFGSLSYFIKCFREQYGYPPGEVGKHDVPEAAAQVPEPGAPEEVSPAAAKEQARPPYRRWGVAAALALLLVLALGYGLRSVLRPAAELEKSIAVLPFHNESSDSSNGYFVNGLMESTIGKLQKIEALRVISRTSSEKYRNSGKTLPEIARELNVAYVVEGSGQRVGDQVLLHIQLIEAEGDSPIWTQQYTREVKDIFDLQNEIALHITEAIEAIVTPTEIARLDKQPTESLEAYDYFLQALEPFYTQTAEGYAAAIPLFEKAIEEDEEFALAYADMAISYYFLDLFRREKQYTEEINRYSDQALLYDAQSDISLLAKAFYYLHTGDYRLALPILEKALEYNPNSSAVVQMLAEFYAYRQPNTAKYLEYALRGIQLDVMGQDSVTRSFSYLHLSNALTQTGFFEEAERYVQASLDFFSGNPYAPHLQIFVQFAQDKDAERAQRRLVQVWERDTTRMDILQDVAKLYYTQGRYDSAYYYFRKLVQVRESQDLRIYPEANAMIAYVYRAQGHQAQADSLFQDYVAYCAQDQTLYKSVNLAVQHAYRGEVEAAMAQLRAFAEQEHFQYWMLLLRNDPLMDPLRQHPDFGPVMQQIEDRFWADHEALRTTLEDKRLM